MKREYWLGLLLGGAGGCLALTILSAITGRPDATVKFVIAFAAFSAAYFLAADS